MRAIVLPALLLIGTALAAGPQAQELQREGTGEARALKDALEQKTPPALEVEGWMNTGNKPLTLDGLKGKVVVIDFWGVWCGPCRAAMPKLKDLHAKHKDAGLVIIGIHTANQGDKMAEFVKEQSIPWPVAVDTTGQTVKAFRVDSFPDYYVIDRSGKLRVADLANADLERAITALLKEPAAR